jgi:uncharacterized membrane protein YdjX (TVP38/TMEM64 family)
MARRSAIKFAVAATLVVAFVGIWLSPLREQMSVENMRGFVGQLRGLWYGPIVFILAFAAGCIFAIPATVFCIAAGLIWGWLGGAMYSIIGGALGAVLSFFVGRYLGEGFLARFGRVGQIVAKQVDHAGFRSMLALRFIPGIPFAVLNYGAGVAGVRFRDYILSTVLGITPPMLVFAYCSDALFNGSMTEGDAAWRLLLVCVLMLTITFLPVLVKRFTRRAPVAE